MLTRPNSAQSAKVLLVLISLSILIATQAPFNYTPQSLSLRGALAELVRYPSNFLDIVENVVMFLPFGFGWAWLSHSWGWQKWRSVLVALLASAGFSLLVEVLQLFIPQRVSSMIDVGTNSLGGLLGAVGLGLLITPPKTFREM
jgi:glycopeptide antibiotics resistance protein